MSRTLESMLERRERKFDRADIEIKEEARTEERVVRGVKDEKGKPVYKTHHFTHAVYRKGKLVGVAKTGRSALKRAHAEAKRIKR